MTVKFPLLALAASGALIAALPSAAFADLYTYVDASGAVHLNSAQVDSRYTLYTGGAGQAAAPGNGAPAIAATPAAPQPALPPQAAAAPAALDISIAAPAANSAENSAANPGTIPGSNPGTNPGSNPGTPSAGAPAAVAATATTASSVAAAAVPVSPGYYGWRDAQGVLHFSSERKDSRYAWRNAAASDRKTASATAASPAVATHPSQRLAAAGGYAAGAGRFPARSRRHGDRHPRRLSGQAVKPVLRPAHGLFRHVAATTLPYARLVDRAARKQGVNGALIHAVIEVESHYRPRAVSAKGAAGLMQLMPDTAKQYGAKNRFDPAQNILAGTRYLKTLLQRFKGDLTLTVAAYNAGEGSVMRYGNHIPPFQETQNYVTSVLTRYRRYLMG